MRENPRHWRGHYHDAANESLDLAYSLSDRIRYYWPHPEVAQACGKLFENLQRRPPPLTLVSQYLPRQYAAIRVATNSIPASMHCCATVSQSRYGSSSAARAGA